MRQAGSGRHQRRAGPWPTPSATSSSPSAPRRAACATASISWAPTPRPNPTRCPPNATSCWRHGDRRRADATDAMAAHDEGDRVPWGGRPMSVRSLATARLMETWAHGLDCFAAASQPAVDTDRLVHVAWLGRQTLPYTFAFAARIPRHRRWTCASSSARRAARSGASDPTTAPTWSGARRAHGAAWSRIACGRPPSSTWSRAGRSRSAALRVAKAYLA